MFGRVFFGRRFVWEVFLRGGFFEEEEVCLEVFFWGRRFFWGRVFWGEEVCLGEFFLGEEVCLGGVFGGGVF